VPLFSVIIPTYNRKDLLEQALASVWAQTSTDYEVIVADDGSTDGTWEELQAFGSGVRVLRQENKGAGAARNAGAAAAKGSYLAFLDSDDLWFPWTLGVYKQVALQHASPAFITGMPLIFTAPAETQRASDEDLFVEAFTDYYASSDAWRWFSASSFVIRKDVFTAVGGFHEQWGAEDAHLTMKLGCSSGFVHIQQPYTFAYRNQVNSLKTAPTYLSSGAKLLIASERNREFPGGVARASERRRVLTRHTRPVALECLERDRHREAWALYRATFRWHCALGRWKFLLGFPLKALLARA
jgi:cellulose synthase/poly-beta-1,6-N-acetylglucosamine synthase-like glycosyltransferase